MHLPTTGREFYRLTITTTPTVAPTSWEASFDNGATWVAGGADGADGVRWLLAGPTAAASGAPSVTINATTVPQVRLIDNPETIIRKAPVIRIGLP